MPSLNRTIALVVGAALLLGIALLGFFMLVKPRRQTIASLRDEMEAHNAYAAKRGSVQRQLDEARAETVRLQQQMDEIYRKKMPDISLEVPVWTMFSLWYETGPGHDWFKRAGLGPGPVGTGTMLTRYFDNIGLPVQGIGVPQWGFAPPDKSMRTLPPLPLTLRLRVKTFDQFLDLFNKFEDAPRFLVVQGASARLAMEGGAAAIDVELPVVMYAWTKGYAAGGAPAAAPAAGPLGAAGAPLPIPGAGGVPGGPAGR